jgi:3-hydroxyisobutyrate dehydrogenase-like beta-hydroxyacid dehydrogenase
MFANAKKGTLFIDCSTIDPIASKEMCAEAKKLGHDMIDAPVSGGVTGESIYRRSTTLVMHNVIFSRYFNSVLYLISKKLFPCL